MAICAVFDPDCYACRLRAKGVAFSGQATPVARASKAAPRTPDPAWERGRAGERRVDGSFMPYLSSSGGPMPIKEASARSAEIRGIRRKHHVHGV